MNHRRDRRLRVSGLRVSAIADIVPIFREMSTKTDQVYSAPIATKVIDER
jgi:hypothetical protein